jgi:integrase
VRGLFLRVYKTGRKSFALKYRVGARQRIHTIGAVGAPWTVELARRAARELLVGLVNGDDPQEMRAADRAALTVGNLIDAYLSEGPVDKPNKRASTWAIDQSNLERHVRPLLGKRRADAVQPKDCAEVQRAIAVGKTKADIKTGVRGRAIVSGGAGTAARTMITLAAMFSWAKKRGLVAENPARSVVRLKGEPKERFLSPEEFERLFSALHFAEQQSVIHARHAAIIRLLAYTGCRKSEILGLKWSEVDIQRQAIALPGPRSKSGAKRVPLSQQAIAELQRQHRDREHVFPPLREGASQHTLGIQKSWNKVRNLAQLDAVRLHDLRHSFASIAVGAGESLYVVQRALGHKKSSTTERYAHLRDDPVRAMVDRVGDILDRARIETE